MKARIGPHGKLDGLKKCVELKNGIVPTGFSGGAYTELSTPITFDLHSLGGTGLSSVIILSSGSN